MKRANRPPAPVELPRLWKDEEWRKIPGRPGWFENPLRPNADGSLPKKFAPELDLTWC